MLELKNITYKIIDKGVEKIILNNVSFIEERSPQTVTEYNEKLKKRIRDLIGDANVDEQVKLVRYAVAPIKQGDILGEIIFTLDGKRISSIPLVAAESIRRIRENKKIIMTIEPA